MKKFLSALFIIAMTSVGAFAGEKTFGAGVWFDCPKSISNQEVEGLALGIPVIANKEVEGASLALCGNHSKKVSGFQGALIGFNYAKSLYGAQIAFANFQEGQHDDCAVQLGFYNQAAENGVQFGFINKADDNATFQLGLININKNGLFPVMIFVNFGKDFFDFNFDFD